MNRIGKFWVGVAFFSVFVFTGAQQISYGAGATITGKVAFEGTAPAPKLINFGAEKQCAVMHGDKPPVNEDLVVNPNQTLKWALVYIKEGVTGQYTAPTEAAVINQNGCMFSPHGVAVMAGQKVTFKNGDPVLHNVRSNAKINKAFNIAQPIQGMTTNKVFEQPEIGVQLKCDVHFWMAGYIHVLSHPFFAITGDDGVFSLKNVPAGTYTVEVWHEKLGTQTAQITVTDGETRTSDFVFKQA